MSEHRCTKPTEGCYRCDLNRDEVAAAEAEARADAQAAWLAYRNRRALMRGLSPERAARQMRRRDFVAGYLAAEGIEEDR